MYQREDKSAFTMTVNVCIATKHFRDQTQDAKAITFKLKPKLNPRNIDGTTEVTVCSA